MIIKWVNYSLEEGIKLSYSKVSLLKYNMSIGSPWMFAFFFFFYQQYGAVDMEIIGGPWAQDSKEIKSWLNQIMSWESKNGKSGPGQSTLSH